MSVSQPESGAAVIPDISSMTEEEQIAYAMQMSLAGGGGFLSLNEHTPPSAPGTLDNCFSCEQSMAKWTREPQWTLQNQPRSVWLSLDAEN